MENKTTLRQAMMAIIADVENRAFGGSYEYHANNISDFDAAILQNIITQCGDDAGALLRTIDAYLMKSTNWVVIRQVGNDSIRACFPGDLPRATECLRRHIMRGNIATLHAE